MSARDAAPETVRDAEWFAQKAGAPSLDDGLTLARAAMQKVRRQGRFGLLRLTEHETFALCLAAHVLCGGEDQPIEMDGATVRITHEQEAL